MKLVLITLGWISIGLGIVGIFLPLLPTTPFLILAAFFFSKGSDRLHHWLLNQPRFGTVIRDWEERGVIRPQAKKKAVLAILVVFSLTLLFVRVSLAIKAIVALIGLTVLVFILTRPSGEEGG